MSWRQIDHVVVLMMENQSFDRILGWMTPEEHDVDGAPRSASCPMDDSAGCEELAVEPGAALIPPGAPHRAHHMFDQFHGLGPGTNRGFARIAMKSAWKRAGLKDENKKELVQEVLRYHRRDDLPVTRDLALNYAVCDRWFCSIASSTWPNRYFLHFGTSPTGKAHLPQLKKNLPTLFSRLTDKGLSWRIYVDGPANVQVSAAITKQRRRVRKLGKELGLTKEQADPLRTFDRFLCDAAPTPEGFADTELATYTFIEPRHWRAKGKEANNDHSGTHLHRGQALIAQVYNRLREHPAWDRTLLVVTYDEHGGYYDHVPPPPAPHPETGELGTVPEEGDLGFYGGRVPTILISPRIQPGAFHEVCDHTSVLAFLERRFDLEPLTHRDANANDLTAAFGDELRTSTLGPIEPPPEPEAIAWAEDWRSDHTELELDLYRYLADKAGLDPEVEIASLDPDTLAEVGELRAAAVMASEVV